MVPPERPGPPDPPGTAGGTGGWRGAGGGSRWSGTALWGRAPVFFPLSIYKHEYVYAENEI